MRQSEGYDFDTWFDAMCVLVLDQTGVQFRDKDSVREDYYADRCHTDVADEIIAEYE